MQADMCAFAPDEMANLCAAIRTVKYLWQSAHQNCNSNITLERALFEE